MKIILETIVGSTLHGTSVDDGLEDLDLMAIGVEDPNRFLGFSVEDTIVTRTKPDGVRSEAGDVDYVCYGLKKYLRLALAGNPTLLLALFAPKDKIRILTEEGKQLQALAPHIVSKQIFNPFRGYMKQQHDRLMGLAGQKNVTRPELIEKYGFDTKYAGHTVRLGYQGIELLKTGRLELPTPKRDIIVDVRTGKYTLDQISMMINILEGSLVNAFETSKLPEHPDFEKVEAWMIDQYINTWAEK